MKNENDPSAAERIELERVGAVETPESQVDAPAARFSRRELFESGARLGFLGLIGAYFVQQRLRADALKDDPTCIKLDTCNDCVEFGGCSLPKSAIFRQQNGLPPIGSKVGESEA